MDIKAANNNIQPRLVAIIARQFLQFLLAHLIVVVEEKFVTNPYP